MTTASGASRFRHSPPSKFSVDSYSAAVGIRRVEKHQIHGAPTVGEPLEGRSQLKRASSAYSLRECRATTSWRGWRAARVRRFQQKSLHVAPRLRASMPTAPEPAYRSRKVAPATRGASTLKSVSRSRSLVGRVSRPLGAASGRERNSPAMTRIASCYQGAPATIGGTVGERQVRSANASVVIPARAVVRSRSPRPYIFCAAACLLAAGVGRGSERVARRGAVAGPGAGGPGAGDCAAGYVRLAGSADSQRAVAAHWRAVRLCRPGQRGARG